MDRTKKVFMLNVFKLSDGVIDFAFLTSLNPMIRLNKNRQHSMRRNEKNNLVE
jgi:hypothetical protein